jgi:hypothetical protein
MSDRFPYIHFVQYFDYGLNFRGNDIVQGPFVKY